MKKWKGQSVTVEMETLNFIARYDIKTIYFIARYNIKTINFIEKHNTNPKFMHGIIFKPTTLFKV